MKKSTLNYQKIIVYLTAIVFLVSFPLRLVNAATVFLDSFQGGFDRNLWNVRAGYLTPSASNFGLGDTFATNWSLLDSSTTSLPNDSISQLDMKINTSVSDVIFSCKTNFLPYHDNDLRVFLHKDGTASLDSYILGGGASSGLFNWNKSPGIHTFQLLCNSGTMTLNEDGIQLFSWITGRDFIPSTYIYFGYKNGDSEFANFKLCDNAGCDTIVTPSPTETITPTPTETPTPTFTPTPIPTPTFTPTPLPTATPTPSQTKTVVVIPGATASWNADALLNCKPDNYKGNWALFRLAKPVYNPLVTALTKAGWTPKMYAYDWRKPVMELEPALASYIAGLAPGGTAKVHIVGHSMGGLVGRSYITQEQAQNKTEKFLSVGSPHLGAPVVYNTWEAGQIWGGNLGWKFLLTTLKKSCSLKQHASDRVAVQTYFKSINNILPVFDYLTDSSTNQPIHYGAMHEKNFWLTNPVNFPLYSTVVATLRGTGKNTPIGYHVEPPASADTSGNWIDGKPVSNDMTLEGDGTVPLTSSEIPNADNSRVITMDHNGLMSSREGINTILGFLGVAPATVQSLTSDTPTVSPEPTSGLFVIAYPADFWIIDPDGNITQDEDSVQVFPDPKSGSYKLMVLPKSNSTRIVVAQFLASGQTLWTEYTFGNLLPKIKTIKFDSANPVADALQ